LRVQVKRGKPTPPGVRRVNRTTWFGNPRKVGDPGVPDRATAVRLYIADYEAGVLTAYKRSWIPMTEELIQTKLRGWHLGCDCPEGERCPAEVLLRIANA
jgi:hypothetical protein